MIELMCMKELMLTKELVCVIILFVIAGTFLRNNLNFRLKWAPPSPSLLWNHAITPVFFQFHAITPKKISFHDHDSYFFKKKNMRWKILKCFLYVLKMLLFKSVKISKDKDPIFLKQDYLLSLGLVLIFFFLENFEPFFTKRCFDNIAFTSWIKYYQIK